MPRRPRIVLPGQPHHIIIRGINRGPVFYDEGDYRYYLSRLKEAIEKHGCDLHAYVVMTNHVHMLLTPKAEPGIGKAIQMLGRYYVQYFNYTYARTGTLWEGRYKSTLVDTEHYLLTCYRYIELNPVRARMVDHPSEYPWSSYRCNGVGQTNSLIRAHYKYEELGRTEEERQRGYRALFKAHISGKELAEIRVATNKEWVLGSAYFKTKIEQQLQRRTTPLP
ncbi:MAG: transposase, partial [Gammaproteobacteria bacterium RBG_16_51_14]